MKHPLALLLLIAGAAHAQEKAAVQISGEEVLVDVVVRDAKGRAITNLPQSAFTLTDEGQVKQITSFRLVQGTESVSQAGAGAASKPDPLRQIRLISLIFDKMDQGERALTRDAALQFLKNELPPNLYIGVFTLGNELQAIQGFTNKRDLLVNAVNKATSRPSSQFADDSAQLRTTLEQNYLGPNQTGAQDLFTRQGQMQVSTDPRNPGSAASMTDAIMARSLLDMISFAERTENNYEGRSTIWALLAAVRGQSQLPGRKAIVYFSEGFAVPQGAEVEFQAVISDANRNNLSFYPIDAHGLTETVQNAKATEGLSAAANGASQSGGFGSAISSGTVNPFVSKINIAQSPDSAIDANHANLQDTLAILAEQTGGFLTANTNDFRAPLQRIAEEIETYYELTYSPHIENYDGKFRQISVKLNRTDLKVQSRAGYFALPPDMLKTTGLNMYEVPLLRALTNVVPNKALPFESGGMHFRGDGRVETCGFLIDMSLSNITLRENADKSKLVGGLAYVALIKDVKGAVVKKLQGDMPLELTRDQVIPLKESRFTDMEYFDVPPGYYTIEVAVLDKETGQTNARRNALVVPKQTDGLAMSSVALIRKWRAKEPDAAPEDPFVIGDKTVTPTLIPKINKSVSTSLPFYVVVYPDSKNEAKPQMFIEFNRDGNVKRVATSALESPDSQGRVQYVANAPIGQFDPGNYAVRFVVTQGKETAEEDFSVLLEP
jgi:VWFA-related protein